MGAGTFANCAGGVTPWGTVLSAEANFDYFFERSFFTRRSDSPVWEAHTASYRPEKGDDRGWYLYDDRFNPSEEPHELFRFGWVVEVDPYDPSSTARKRTALGRFRREGDETVTLAPDGRVAVYSGEDQELRYIYKFVAAAASTGTTAGPTGTCSTRNALRGDGPCLTPTNGTLFVSIQHPGRTDDSDLATAISHWPDGDPHPPRPSVVVVTKKDGGIIGS